MTQANLKPSRPWREIAELAAQEHDPQRALQLAQELIRALDVESDQRMESIAQAKKGARQQGAA